MFYMQNCKLLTNILLKNQSNKQVLINQTKIFQTIQYNFTNDINDEKSYFKKSLRTYNKNNNHNNNQVKNQDNQQNPDNAQNLDYYKKKLNKNLPSLKNQKSKENFQYEPEVKAFSQGLPQDWSSKDILKYFQKQPNYQQGDIKEVYIVKNKIGQSTGKAIFVFKDLKTKESFVEKYNGEFVQTDQYLQRFIMKNFEVKKKREYSNKQLAKLDTVYLYNMAYTITNQQIYEMAEDFGEVVYIDIPMKTEELNKGYGFIKFGNWQQAQKFQEYYNEKTIDHRQIKIQIKNFEFDRHKKKSFDNKYDKILDINSFKDTVKNENMNLYNMLKQGEILDGIQVQK